MRRRRLSAARACWLLVPCALGLLSCAQGRSTTPVIPKPSAGTYHHVRPGETLAAIGRLYGLEWKTLAKANELADPHHLEVGQSIWIPSSARQGYPRLPPLAVPSRFAPDRVLQWPAQGLLSSDFGQRGRRLHAGIDISGERGTPIVAADAGVVLFSGSGPNGYGNTVMLHHNHGLITLYAHNERNVVRQGDRVRRGQVIAYMGDTGRASGTHLHFEVHQEGRLTDPRRWLQ
jgi:murein DD-endopeptidase MepM/ murein hydrolase activator NlpD